MADHVSSTGDLRAQLQALLDEKEKQLQHAGTLGQRVLEQQMELEERISQLRDLDADRDDDDEIDVETRERYRELAQTVQNWDSDNARLTEALATKRSQPSPTPTPTLPPNFSINGDLSREEPERGNKAGSQTAAQSRRAKNAAHRQNDVEFAFEIGSGLLTEVRRLQSLLGERDKAIQDMKEEKDDLEKTVETLRIALKEQEQSADKFKEENWNLEVTMQELKVQLNEAQSSVQRLEGEHKRATKLLAAAREAADTHKTEAERMQTQYDEFKAKHDTIVAQARKHAAGLARDKSDLQQTLDSTKAELARASKRLPRFGAPLTPLAANRTGALNTPFSDEEELFSAGGLSARGRRSDVSGLFPNGELGDFAADDEVDASPSKRPQPNNEVETLQQRLAHAQRQISTLKSTLQREKEQKIDYRRRLEQAPATPVEENGVEDDDDSEDAATPVEEHSDAQTRSRRLPPIRVGRGRGRGARGNARGGSIRGGRSGFTLSERLALAGQSPGSEYADYDDFPSSPPPPIPSLPSAINVQHASMVRSDEEDGDVFSDGASVPTSPTTFEPPSNRTSLDGMDPAFANILRRSTSARGSLVSPHRGNPISRGTFSRRRGGAAFQEVRPPSVVVNQPGALALELGMGDDSLLKELREEPEAKQTAEFGCQTQEVPVPAKTMAEREIQVTPEPVPEPVKPSYAEMDVQTNPEPVVVAPIRTELGVQYDIVEPEPAARAEVAILTEPVEPLVREVVVVQEVVKEVPPVLAPRVDAVMLTEPMEEVVREVVKEVIVTQEVVKEVSPVVAPRVDASIITEPVEEVVREVIREVVVTNEVVKEVLPTLAPRVDASIITEPIEEAVREVIVTKEVIKEVPPVLVPRVDAFMLTEPVEEAVREVIVTKEVIKEVQPTPVPRADASMSTDPVEEIVREVVVVKEVIREVPPAPRDLKDSNSQTLPPPVVVAPVKADADSQTLPPPAAVSPAKANADTQTPAPVFPQLVHADMQTMVESDDEDALVHRSRRTTLTQRDLPRLGVATGAAFPIHRETDDEDDARTETGLDTDLEPQTESETDYHDALHGALSASATTATTADGFVDASQSLRSLALTSPATDSVADFHSIMTVTDNDLSDSEDGVSPITPAAEHAPRTFEEKSISADAPEPKPTSLAVVATPTPAAEQPKPAPKPEVKEMCIQTDEWQPPAVAPSAGRAPSTPSTTMPAPVFVPIPVVASPASNGVFRPSNAHQFQFVPSSSPGPSSIIMPSPAGTPARDVNRDSSATFMPRQRTSLSERRQSIESALSSYMEEPSRSRKSSAQQQSPAVDKSRPPMMVLPPPPRMPPPPVKSLASPSSNMPPPSFIPERRIATKSNASDEPPRRPSSPPPPELIKRATTPLLNAGLNVPTRSIFGSARAPGSSMSPTATTMRQPPSTSSFRSVSNAASQQPAYGSNSLLAPVRTGRREPSSTSLQSNGSFASPRSSVSSDHQLYNGSGTPEQSDVASRRQSTSTDPTVIHAITQTMIGEFLYKYTRRPIGKGHGERRHKRFFWIHPYTKTLYWGSADPGSTGVAESTAKSAFIEGVRSVLDPNPMPPGLYQYSIVVSTPQREMKFTAPTKERHDIWLNALQFLLTRPSTNFSANGSNEIPPSPMSAGVVEEDDEDEDERPIRPGFPGSPSSRSGTNTTPRGRRSASQLSTRGSIIKRSGTPAAEYLRWSEREATSPYSPTAPDRSFEHVQGGLSVEDEEDLDFELNDESLSDGGYDGLENVRACCDGRHTVGHHHHHHHTAPPEPEVNPPPRAPSRNGWLAAQNLEPAARPSSPSGWSLRSRAGSTNSRTGLNIFTRFGSTRSAKTTANR